MNLFIASGEQALLLLPLVFGIFITYRILNITDLAVDGTYVLGAAVFARTIEWGVGFALLLSISAGAFIGMIVGFMQRHNKVDPLVVGILSAFMLYSVNLQLMGRPNISLLDKPTILSFINGKTWLFPLMVIGGLLMVSLICLIKSHFGLLLRAFGYNQKLLSILGKPIENYRLFGLALSHLLAALTGALTCQVNGFTDINMGFGIALISIGALVIGRHLIVKNRKTFVVYQELISCCVGIFLYFLCLNGLLRIGVNPVNLKFILGATLFFTLWNIHRAVKT